MNMHATEHEPEAAAPPTTDREMLDAVYRRLVGIHASVAEATNSDPEIRPWTERELMDVIRQIGAFRREHPKANHAR